MCFFFGRKVRMVSVFWFMFKVICLLMLLVKVWIGKGLLMWFMYIVLKCECSSRKIVLLRLLYSCSSVGWYRLCMFDVLLVCVVRVNRFMFR